MKAPSLEMFTAQLSAEPSTTWLKFGVGSDLDLWSKAWAQMVSTGYEGFEKPKLVLRKINKIYICIYIDTDISSYACTQVKLPVCCV